MNCLEKETDVKTSPRNLFNRGYPGSMNGQVEIGKRAFELLKIDQEILSRRNKKPVTFRRRNLNAETSQGCEQRRTVLRQGRGRKMIMDFHCAPIHFPRLESTQCRSKYGQKAILMARWRERRLEKHRLRLLCAPGHVLLSIYLDRSHLSEGSMSEDV